MAVVMGVTYGAGNNMRSFLMPKRSEGGSPVEPDFDQNDRRRKRQRISSSENQSDATPKLAQEGGVHPPRAAVSLKGSLSLDKLRPRTPEIGEADVARASLARRACTTEGQCKPNNDAIRPVEDHGDQPKAPEQLDPPTNAEEAAAMPPQRVLRVRPDGKLVSPTTKHPTQIVTPAEKISQAYPDGKPASSGIDSTLQNGTRPRNILGVQSDGKLGSLQAKENSPENKPKRGRKPKKKDADTRSMVVVLRYGGDQISRLAIGHNIDDILLGIKTVSAAPKTQNLRPAEPPKATHPFFLGGASHNPRTKASDPNDEQQKSEADANLSAVRRKMVSPIKARVTSKPAGFAEDTIEPFASGRTTFSSDHARVCRFPGAMEPIWPPKGMLHVSQEIATPSMKHHNGHSVSQILSSRRKLKGVEITVPSEEEVLRPYIDLTNAYRDNQDDSQDVPCRERHRLRLPVRRLMTGHALQKAVSQKLSTDFSRLGRGSNEDYDIDELSGPEKHQVQTHKALRQVFERIPTSFTAFDKFECETQDWVHKYAPMKAENALQQGPEAMLLRNWLRSLTVTSIEDVDSRSRESLKSRKLASKLSKRKRKRAEEMEGFVISSDEEENQMDEITHPEDNFGMNHFPRKTIVCGGNSAGTPSTFSRSANAVVISGPHGCGKTAAVYATAQELGFEVFEINAGSRRSGKDILDKVGDMTRNHLVRGVAADAPPISSDENVEPDANSEQLQRDIESGRQGKMNNFFKAKDVVKKKQSKPKETAVKATPQESQAPKKQQAQKQSLILLEEVDVLFEEDRLFWPTILELILQSKRPVIMTCTDESFLPLYEMALYAILRFSAPSEQLAVDYLLLVACNEGHLLSRDAVSELYRAKGQDLRASITELNFFCQMAVGDTKGGLEWMLIKSFADNVRAEKDVSLRVVSDGTYQPFMGWLSGEGYSPQKDNSVGEEVELLSAVWNGWGIDIGASARYLLGPVDTTITQSTPTSNLQALKNFDQAAEALSATDTFPACVCRQSDNVVLEPTCPELTDKARCNYVESSNVLLADPLIDPRGMAEALALTLRVYAKRHLDEPLHVDETFPSLETEHSIPRMLPDIVQERRSETLMITALPLAAFEPIARCEKPIQGLGRFSPLSSFDSPMSSVYEDLAPYVRNIVAYDLKLEEQRRQLDALLLGSGKNSKKARTTRASRAALEGGQKASTRRERWFSKDTKVDLVLQSGGKNWQETLQRRMLATTGQIMGPSDRDDSRRSSIGTAVESDIEA